MRCAFTLLTTKLWQNKPCKTESKNPQRQTGKDDKILEDSKVDKQSETDLGFSFLYYAGPTKGGTQFIHGKDKESQFIHRKHRKVRN